MSLDISVTNPETGEQIEMNWLRNSYGLEYWARTNYNYVTKSEQPEEKSLWYVINHWNYDKAPDVDRALFLNVVNEYGKVIQSLEKGYFFYTESAFRQFIQPHWDLISAFTSARIEYGDLRGINMEYLGHPAFGLSDKYRPEAHTLKRYQEWYAQLVALAEMLQDPITEFYCSN